MPKSDKFKLNWEVSYDQEGNIVRRRLPGETLGVEYVDVVWTHEGGFPPSVETRPVSYDYVKKEHVFSEVEVGGRRDKILDQVSVMPGTTDLVIVKELEGKRAALAKALGVEP